MMESGKSSEHSLHSASEASSADSGSQSHSDASTMSSLTPSKRERERRKSPATSSDNTSTSVQPPMSPTSSVADTTFEPTIDMMVNDFDDEATLNEEEALADQEAHSAEDEIATLREESEMPIEELLAKYGGGGGGGGGMASSPAVSTSNRSASSSRRGRRATKRQYQELDTETPNTSHNDFEPEQLPRKEEESGEASMDTDETTQPLPAAPSSEGGARKQHRSHLLDLYPEESFADLATSSAEDAKRFTPLQTLFDEVEADEEEEDSESESMDDARKIIMVGNDYQAEIPEGLSQYGDILPYENEDQLIWEPSQVSEREVEDYLAKIQETRAIVPPEEGEGGEETSAAAITAGEAPPAAPAPPPPAATPPRPLAVGQDQDQSVVKDNEQALHLLVQCGYDFKEALRRKRMNVLPLSSDTMSSWSEDECLKFEEGIHKFGKDFLQIRQNQVRTRTMRELVHFYYLWKKSERRDQSFALNDTIDHMDVFINEAGAGNGNGNGIGNGTTGTGNSNGSCSPHSSSNGHSNGELVASEKDPGVSPRKSASKNYSIMTGGQAAATPQSSGSRKRGASASLQLEDEDNNVDVEPNLAAV
ncbi:hypothetical protein KR054_002675 [Drosophila jambulina]|nr:hypothetical protein KR054_002675 [Drosophila jambulina]